MGEMALNQLHKQVVELTWSEQKVQATDKQLIHGLFVL